MQWAWLIPVFSIAVVPFLIFFGKFLPGKGAFLAIAAIAAGFLMFGWVFLEWSKSDESIANCSVDQTLGVKTCRYVLDWFATGHPGYSVDSVYQGISGVLGIVIDPLAISMLGLITLVSLMVQIYSLGYMKGDPRLNWYYAFHAMFAAAMLGLILADNFLMLYIAWELVGACSYLLIGFWFERPAAREAAKKAFVVTRIGDVGLLVGILLLWSQVGSFSMSETFAAAQSGMLAPSVITWSAILIFLGAAGKSAQFPFHVWLPDAMEGPTPVSALIHAATMVAAGVYLVARAFPLFEQSTEALMIVSVVGLITALGAATIALVSTDLKRILAYSTISHLGLMMLSLGALGNTAAIFHLVAHGVSKALLFLGAGSVMHSTDELDIRELGGLRTAMPITAILFSIGALSLGGIPVLAGFWSKDEILLAVYSNLPPVFIILTLLTVFLSALYMARAMFLVFYGSRGISLGAVHESPASMTWTMGILGFLAVTFGFLALNLGGILEGFGHFVFFSHAEEFHFNWWLGSISILLALTAFVAAYLAYFRYSTVVSQINSKLSIILRLIENKYYIDQGYQWVIDKIVLGIANLIGYLDRVVVNDIGVNGPARIIRVIGISFRLHITGNVYSYALGMVIGTIGLVIFWWSQSV